MVLEKMIWIQNVIIRKDGFRTAQKVASLMKFCCVRLDMDLYQPLKRIKSFCRKDDTWRIYMSVHDCRSKEL